MIQAISLPDPNKMSNLSVPRKTGHSSFFPPVNVPAATTEMTMPSISFSNAVSCSKLKCSPQIHEPAQKGRSIPTFWVPVTYVALAVLFELGNVLSMQWLRAFPSYASPPLAVLLFIHGLDRDPWLFFASVALACALPAFSHDALHTTGYLLCFSFVACYGFWRELRHVWLALAALCVCGAVCGAAVTFHTHDKAGLHVSWLSALLLAAVCTKRLGEKQLTLAESQAGDTAS